MLINYFKIALRNIFKYKIFSFINIAGMSISLACVFVIALFVQDELSYDKHISNVDRKFRVYDISTLDGGQVNTVAITPYPFATYLQKDYPEIESTLRIMDSNENLFEVGDKKIKEPSGIYAEPGVVEMFSLDLLDGDAKTMLEKPATIILKKTLAEKYFGNEDPIGKTIKISKEDYTVTGVFADLPQHFHLKINYIFSFTTLTRNFAAQRYENWQFQQFGTYIKLKPGASSEELEAKLPDFAARYAHPKTKPEGLSYIPHLQSIRDIHLHSSDFQWDSAQRGNAQSVYILMIAGTLILIIACLNFINLSTARSMKRMKEVGVRKVVGALRKQLITQFMIESIVITFIGLAFAIAITELTLPFLNSFTEKNISDPFNFNTIGLLILSGILLGFLAGSFPALHLSKFRPAIIFANKEGRTGGIEFFRKSLVVLQFAFSLFLIISAMIVTSQNDLLRNQDLGFNKEQLVVLKLSRTQMRKSETMKHEYLNHSNIIDGTLSFGLPGDVFAQDGVTDVATGKNWATNLFIIDHDYIKTMGIEVVAGRGFSKDFPSDLSGGFILNETAVQSFGYNTPEEAVGKKINWKLWGYDSVKHGEVVGVVKDFNVRSLREKVSPVVMQIFPDYFWTLTMRIKPEGIQETLVHLKSTWESAEKEWPFEYSFIDKSFDDMYKSEAKLSTLLTWFTGLAIVVACLGLFGLVEYSVTQRAKEISIRKVFGAGVLSLLVLVTKRYFVLIAISFLIVIPLSYYASAEWLEGFAYRISISPLIFMKAAALIIIITIVTVIFQSLKAVWTNPAQVLKNE